MLSLYPSLHYDDLVGSVEMRFMGHLTIIISVQAFISSRSILR